MKYTAAMIGHAIPTGWKALDFALGSGGIPLGKLTEISGPAESGKTSLALSIVAQANRLGLTCAWIDADHTFDLGYARKRGVLPDRVLYSDPPDAEQALGILEALVRTADLGLIVLDSANGLIPHAELQQELGKTGTIPYDPLLSRTLSAITQPLRQANIALLITSLADQSLSRVYHGLSANPARLALGLRASLRLRLRRLADSCRVEIRIIKNDFTATFARLELDLFNNDGMINKS